MKAMYNKCGRVIFLIVSITIVFCLSACSRITITLNANGGLINGKSSVKHTITNDDSFSKVPNPTREGYDFDGWYTAKTGGTKITKNSTIPKKNTTYYAHWTAKQVTIKWDANGGVVTCSGKRKVGTKMILCSYSPTREGYNFDGWYTKKTGGSKITTSTDVPTRDTTYYAHWKAKQVTITWHPNNGRPAYEGVRTVGTLMKLCEHIPTRDGYSFAGWYTTKNGGKKITTSTIVPTSNTTYYAHWTKNDTEEQGNITLPTLPTQSKLPILPTDTVNDDRVIQGTLKIDVKLYEDRECNIEFDGTISKGNLVHLRGFVISSDNNITKIYAGFKDRSEKKWLKIDTQQNPVKLTPNENTYNLKKLDESISFGNLEIGNYRFVIEATNDYGEIMTFSTNVEVKISEIVVYARGGCPAKITIEKNGKLIGSFSGSTLPTTNKGYSNMNDNDCGIATVKSGTYIITFANSNYKKGTLKADGTIHSGWGAPCYRVSTLDGSGEIPATRDTFPANKCTHSPPHGYNYATDIMVHQAPNDASGTWSTGCITIRGDNNGTEEMKRFSKLLSDNGCSRAILVIER